MNRFPLGEALRLGRKIESWGDCLIAVPQLEQDGQIKVVESSVYIGQTGGTLVATTHSVLQTYNSVDDWLNKFVSSEPLHHYYLHMLKEEIKTVKTTDQTSEITRLYYAAQRKNLEQRTKFEVAQADIERILEEITAAEI